MIPSLSTDTVQQLLIKKPTASTPDDAPQFL